MLFIDLMFHLLQIINLSLRSYHVYIRDFFALYFVKYSGYREIMKSKDDAANLFTICHVPFRNLIKPDLLFV
jgi:hypothetical protein